MVMGRVLLCCCKQPAAGNEAGANMVVDIAGVSLQWGNERKQIKDAQQKAAGGKGGNSY